MTLIILDSQNIVIQNIKEIDSAGRIVIPKEMRSTFNMGKSVELVMTNDGILIRNPEYVLVEKKRLNII